MIDYLKKYNININDIEKIFNKDIISKFEIMEYNVISVLDYLQSIGVNNFNELIFNRPDICFMSVDVLKVKIQKLDLKLVNYIIENDVQNLINFDI